MFQRIKQTKPSQILIAFFNYFSEPLPKDRDNALLYWRMRIFSTIFLITVFVGTFSYIPNINIAIKSGQLLSGIIYTLAYLLCAMVFFAKPIPFRIRVWTGLLTFYGVGLASLIFLGPVGSGRMYLFAFALLASLLLGLRAGFLALVLNMSTYFSIGWFLSGGQLQWTHITVEAAEKWMTTGYSFFFFNTVITVSTGVLVAALEKNLNKEQTLTKKLTRSNIKLEQEVVERRMAEKELWESRERYKALTDNLHVGIYRNTAGSKGQFLEANPAIVEMFGFQDKNEFLNINVSTLYQNPADREKFNEKMRTSGFVRNEELRLQKKDGSPIICSISAVAVKDKQGKVKCYDGVINDITELKQLEHQFHQAQKMEAIGTLAGGIAHDFNNILSAIMGYTELSRIAAPEGELKNNLNEIYNASTRAKDLVNHILAFSRQSGPERKPIQIGPIVKEAIKMLRASMPTTIEIQQDIDGNTGTITADATQIHQVLMNLCTNAYQAMNDKGGVLKISLSNAYVNASQAALNSDMRPGEYLKLMISDTGHGMSDQVLKRIYEPYYTTKAKGTGTGLGLSVVHGIVRGFKGAITVKSRPNEGTTFEIFIPTVKKSVKSAPKIAEALQTGKEQILFVDDEQMIVDIGKQMLERLGYTVSTRTSGVEALELFKNQPEKFDLVITDLTMPNMTGEAFAKELLKIHSEIPIILCTGFSEQLTKEEALEIGIREFIMKPIAMSQMAKTVRKALDN